MEWSIEGTKGAKIKYGGKTYTLAENIYYESEIMAENIMHEYEKGTIDDDYFLFEHLSFEAQVIVEGGNAPGEIMTANWWVRVDEVHEWLEKRDWSNDEYLEGVVVVTDDD